MLADNDGSWVDEGGNEPVYRSDGGGFITASWWCCAVAAISWMVMFMIPAHDILGNFDPIASQSKMIALIIASALMSLWIMLLAVGHIIRAIYFIPGESMKACAETSIAQAQKKARKVYEENVSLEK